MRSSVQPQANRSTASTRTPSELSNMELPPEHFNPCRTRDRCPPECPASGYLALHLFPQLEPLDLPRRRLRQLVHEGDPPRILVGREALLHELLQLLRGRLGALLQHHERLGFVELLIVGVRDHRRL